MLPPSGATALNMLPSETNTVSKSSFISHRNHLCSSNSVGITFSAANHVTTKLFGSPLFHSHFSIVLAVYEVLCILNKRRTQTHP